MVDATHVVGEVGDGGDVGVDVEGALLQVVVLVEVQPCMQSRVCMGMVEV